MGNYKVRVNYNYGRGNDKFVKKFETRIEALAYMRSVWDEVTFEGFKFTDFDKETPESYYAYRQGNSVDYFFEMFLE